MKNQFAAPKLSHSKAIKTYRITIMDVKAKKIVQEYDTETAIVFGIDKQLMKVKNPNIEPVRMFQLGSPFELSYLLEVIVGNVSRFTTALTDKIVLSHGKKAD